MTNEKSYILKNMLDKLKQVITCILTITKSFTFLFTDWLSLFYRLTIFDFKLSGREDDHGQKAFR